MKKSLLTILAIFLMTTGAAMAQTANSSAPGPTVQREPGMNSNNMPNPGNPQTDLTRDRNTATTKAAEPTGGVDVDVDTGARANGAVDVDATMTNGDADTNATGIDETRTGPATQADDGSGANSSALPSTASELPLLGIAGLLALASAFTARLARKA